MTEILPCPFCGGTANHCMPTLNGHAIKCDDCGNQTPAYVTAGIAITRWNSRQAIPASAQGARIAARDLAKLDSLRNVMRSAFANGPHRLMSIWGSDLEAIDAAIAALSSDGGVESGHTPNIRPGGTAGDGLPDARVVKSDSAVSVAGGLVTQAGVAPGPSDAALLALSKIETQMNEMRSLKGWRMNLIRQHLEEARTALSEGMREKLPQFVIRRNEDGSIDEVVGEVRFIHVEQMNNNSWFIAFDTPDGAQQRFWLGSKNRKTEVVFRYDETIPSRGGAA